jgi:fumarylacetoacetate (FAA) hydrolase family protein
MQFVPTASELAAAIARLLEEQVGGEVPVHLQHPVRVAAHLARLLEREARLGPANADRERALLTEVLGTEVDDPQAAAATRIREADDAAFERRAWEALVEITRLDLAIAKPGHDGWEGE